MQGICFLGEGHTDILYLLEVSLLSELLLVQPDWEVCLCQCACVWICLFVCRQQPCLKLWCTCSLFPRPTVQSGRQVVPRSYLSHWLLSLSLPFTLASWYALSPALGILFMPLKEKKRDLSLLLCRGCSMPQLLLQVNQGLKHTDYAWIHNTNCT